MYCVKVIRRFYSLQIHDSNHVTTANGHAVSSATPPLLIRTVDVAMLIICVTFEATIDFVCPGLLFSTVVKLMSVDCCNKTTEQL